MAYPLMEPHFDPANYGLDQYDLFISYCRRNIEFVQRLHRALTVHNLSVWADWEDIPPTADWWKEIRRGIDRADNFIFVLTPESLSSKVCREELDHAVSRGKRLIPIVWLDVSEDVPESLGKLNWIFFRETDDFDGALAKLLTALNSDLEYVRVHTRMLSRAKEWKNGDRDGSFLLQGKQLEQAKTWLAESNQATPHPTQLHHEYIDASIQAGRFREQVEHPRTQEARNRDRLLNLVCESWIKGVLHNSLAQAQPIEISLRRQPTAITPPWQVFNPEIQAAEALQIGIIELFNQLGAGRTLLILGAPGSGKTTLLLLLAQHLIDCAQRSPDHLIPVVLNLSSWRGQTLGDWLVEEMGNKYQVPRQIGHDWVREQLLLLLLDGLDEIPLQDRGACISVINAFQRATPTEMVICSRTKDYFDLQSTLNFQTAVAVEPLNNQQIQTYLTRQELAGLRGLIRQDPTFEELARLPLTLNLMAIAYQSLPTTSSLLHPDQAERRAERQRQLFDAYVDRAFARRGDSDAFKTQSLYWLIWLAQRLTDSAQTVFLIEQMQPRWLQSKVLRWRYDFILRLLVGIACGMSIGLLSGVLNNNGTSLPSAIPGLSSGVLAGLTAGLFQGVISGLISGLMVGLWRKVRSPLSIALLAGTTFLALGAMWQSLPNFPPWLDFDTHPLKILDGMLFGLVFGIVMRRLRSPSIESVDTVKWSWQRFRRMGWQGAIYGGVIASVLLLLKQTIAGYNLTDTVCTEGNQIWLNALLDHLFCSIDLQLSVLERFLGIVTLSGFVGLTVGMGLGFHRVSEVETRTRPNQGIVKSFHNALRLVLVGLPSFVLSFLTWRAYAAQPDIFWWIYYGAIDQALDGLAFAGVVSLMVGLTTGFIGGEGSGLVCIQHLILRFILWQAGHIPWNYAKFLDQLSDRILLQKVGGGYIFMHRLLLEHLAQKPAPKV
jgi:eukaryotic-like serine/threonine-protein kinase